MGIRRRGREASLRLLYALEFHPEELWNRCKDIFWENFEFHPDVEEFAKIIVSGVLENFERINEAITATSIRWKIERMSTIDRNIIRIAAFELIFRNDIPVKVSINEAIEIAKKYGTSESPSFVNGILDKIAEKTGRLKKE